MRLSAVLVAFFTATATLGLSNSANCQILSSEPLETGVVPDIAEPQQVSKLSDSPQLLVEGEPSPEPIAKSSKVQALAVANPAEAIQQPWKQEGSEPNHKSNVALNLKGDRSLADSKLKTALKTGVDELVPLSGTSQNQPNFKGDRSLADSKLKTALNTRVDEVVPLSGTSQNQPNFKGDRDSKSAKLKIASDRAAANIAQTRPSPPADTAPPPPNPQEIPPAPPPRLTPTPAPSVSEPQVLVAEVVVSGVEGELQDQVYQVISTQPGRTTTRSQLQQDINAIFATGFFKNVRAVPEDTPLGVRVTFVVQANPVLRSVQVTGQQVLPQKVIDDSFGDQYGKIINLRRFEEGVKKVNQWYQDNGYVLAQVLDTPQVADDGTVTLQVVEGVIEEIEVRYLNKEGESTDAKGQPIKGNTRPFIITREVEQKPGDIFNRTTAERDLKRVFGLGIFEDVRLSPEPGTQDPRKVRLIVNVIERNTGSIAAGAGLSSATGLFGTISYQQQNLGGNNQKLGAELQIGEKALLFDVGFTDPWIGGDPYRTSYTVNGFRRRTISVIFDGGKREVRLPNGDRPRILRTGGGVTFTRPLSKNVFVDPEWTASVGFQYQRVTIRDSDGDPKSRDELGNLLTYSGGGSDDLFTIQAGLVRDVRDDLLRPTRGSVLRLGTEQSIPLGSGAILFNRLRANYSYYIPVRYTRFSPGPQTLAFNIQAGTILGDLPPYEAFPLGGANSIRGYDEGDVGAGRHFLQATAEYRFPILSFVGGAFFVDVGTDLGSGKSVPGNPAGIRRKPGSGYGYGLGVRIQSPLGPIRIDFGFNDEGKSRLHFGLGERF